MPSVTGRVCYHPCETACNRAAHDEPIGIRGVERFLGDFGLNLPDNPIKEHFPPLNGKTVAVVEVPCDTILVAIGQVQVLDWLPETATERGRVRADEYGRLSVQGKGRRASRTRRA